MNEEGLSGMIVETSFGGIILVIVVSAQTHVVIISPKLKT
jgi:hypothetical protein